MKCPYLVGRGGIGGQATKAALCHDGERGAFKSERTKLARTTEAVARGIYSPKARASSHRQGYGRNVFRVADAPRANHRVCGVSSITSTTHKKDTQQGVLFVVGRGGFEPPKSKTSDLQSDPFGRSGICPYEIDFVVEPVIGLEPTTC